jgi:hypothetical protein
MASKPDIFGNYTDEKGILRSATTKKIITDLQKKQIQDFIKHMKTYKPTKKIPTITKLAPDYDLLGNEIKNLNEAGIEVKPDGSYYEPLWYDDYEELLPLSKKKTTPKIKQLSPPSSKSSNSSIVSDIFGADTPNSSVTNSSTSTSTSTKSSKSTKSKSKSTKSNSDVIIPIVGETELAVPEFFAAPYTNTVVNKKTKKETTYIRYRLVNPLTKARNLSQRKGTTSIKLIRKPVENAIIMSHSNEPIPLNLFSKKDRETIDKHFQVIKNYKDTPVKEIPDSKDFYNGERGRPEVLQKNIDVMRSRGQMPNTNIDVFIGGKEGGEGEGQDRRSFLNSPNQSFQSSQSYSEPPTPKPKREYKRIKPLKYATAEEAKKALQQQKNESGKLKRDTAKFGLEKAIQLRDEKRAKDKASGNDWFSGLTNAVLGNIQGKGLTDKIIHHFSKDNKELKELSNSFKKHLKTEKMTGGKIKGRGQCNSTGAVEEQLPPFRIEDIPTYTIPNLQRYLADLSIFNLTELRQINTEILTDRQRILDILNNFSPFQLQQLIQTSKIPAYDELILRINQALQRPREEEKEEPIEGIGLKNKIFSNIIMPKKGKKVDSDSDSSSDNEGMGLYAGGGLYASGSAPSGRGIQHIHHYHHTEMSGEGVIHHHHHIEGGSIKSVGNDIKKAFQPVKNAFDKVKDVATPYNAEVAAHYLIPAATSALGGAAGSVVGGPLGGIVGSAGGAYGGQQIDKKLGIDDNTTFKGMGIRKFKKGSQEAKDYMAKIRGMRKK